MNRPRAKAALVSLLVIASFVTAGSLFAVGSAIASDGSNSPPVGTPDRYVISADQTLSIDAPGILANDVDFEGENLTATAILDSVENGSLSAFADGAFTYTPDDAFVGTDAFAYQMRDESGHLSDPVTVTIEVLPAANRAPIGTADNYTMTGATTLEIASPGFLANDIDLDGENLTATAILESVDNGTLTAFADGAITYTPEDDFVGTDQFAYRMRDASGHLSDPVPVTIEVRPRANRDPLGLPDRYTAVADTPLSIEAPGILANDLDLDGENLTATAILESVDNGTLTAFAEGSITYTPNLGFVGNDSFAYQLRDESGHLSEPVTVTISVVAGGSTPVGSPDQYAIPTDRTLAIDAPGVLSNDIDRDGENLTATAILDDVDNGSLAVFADGSFTYTPDEGFVGNDSFTYQMRDESVQFSDPVTVTIEVLPAANRAPIGTADRYRVPNDRTLSIGDPGLLANDVDPDGETLAATAILDGVDNGSLSAFADGSFTYTPEDGFVGNDSFTYQMRDASGHFSDPIPVTIEVLPAANRAPVGTADRYATFVERPLTIDVPGFLTNDLDLDGEPLTPTAVLDGVDNGTLSAFADGSFTYTPEDGFVGNDSFVYQMRDASGHLSEPVTVTITVLPGPNQPPVVDAPDVAGSEGSAVSMNASFTDPDDADVHQATVDWGDGTVEAVAVDQGVGFGWVNASHVYGDDGAFTVTVNVTDDDDGTGADSATVTVDNVGPTVSLDTADAIDIGDTATFVGRVGVEQTHAATAVDPGSDDLTFAWNLGETTTYFNDGSDPDPPLSPGGTFPFAATDTATVTFTTVGLTDIAVTVTDDDGGTASASVPKVVVGDASATRGLGFWRHQVRGNGRPHYDAATMTAFLDIVTAGSGVFSDVTEADTVEQASDVMDVRGPDMRARAEAHLLAAWLNFAAGGVTWDEPIDTDGDGEPDAPFHAVIGEIEGTLEDPDASHDELERAKDLAEAINGDEADSTSGGPGGRP